MTPQEIDALVKEIAAAPLAERELMIAMVFAEIESLRAEVSEWLCESCNYVYPGPPQLGFACVICPRCKGSTAPRKTVELKKAADRIEALQSRLAGAEKALRCVRPLLNDLSNNDRAVIDSPLWRFGQDAKVQLRSIDDTLRTP